MNPEDLPTILLLVSAAVFLIAAAALLYATCLVLRAHTFLKQISKVQTQRDHNGRPIRERL